MHEPEENQFETDYDEYEEDEPRSILPWLALLVGVVAISVSVWGVMQKGDVESPDGEVAQAQSVGAETATATPSPAPTLTSLPSSTPAPVQIVAPTATTAAAATVTTAAAAAPAVVTVKRTPATPVTAPAGDVVSANSAVTVTRAQPVIIPVTLTAGITSTAALSVGVPLTTTNAISVTTDLSATNGNPSLGSSVRLTATPVVTPVATPVATSVALPTVTPVADGVLELARTVRFGGIATLRVNLGNDSFSSTGGPLREAIEARSYALDPEKPQILDTWCKQVGLVHLTFDLDLQLDPETGDVTITADVNLFDEFCENPGELTDSASFTVEVPSNESVNVEQDLVVNESLLKVPGLLDTRTTASIGLKIVNEPQSE